MKGSRSKKLSAAGSGVLEDFFDSGFSIVDVSESILAEGHHAQLDGFLTKFECWSPLGDHVADRVRHIQQLVKAFAAFVAAVATS